MTGSACRTYVEVLDVYVVLPELPQPVGEVLDQLAAAADADREARQAAAGAQEQQGGQEEARREHGVGSEVVRGRLGSSGELHKCMALLGAEVVNL